MKRTNTFLRPWSLIFVAVLLFSLNGLIFSQDQTDEELKKKYEAIIGDYEIDLSEIGGAGREVLIFYVEDGELWADYGELWADSSDWRPAFLEPMEDLEFAFAGEDSEQGRIEFYFLKDENKHYTKCLVVIESLGLEIIGFKIDG